MPHMDTLRRFEGRLECHMFPVSTQGSEALDKLVSLVDPLTANMNKGKEPHRRGGNKATCTSSLAFNFEINHYNSKFYLPKLPV